MQSVLRRAGYDSSAHDDPYSAILELLERPMVHRAVVLSLQGLYKEELDLIRTLRRVLPHVEVWLTHTDGRAAATAEAMRLGASGLVGDDGLHRIVEDEPTPATAPTVTSLAAQHANARRSELADTVATLRPAVNAADEERTDEPILTADELRALLAEGG